MSTLTHPGQRRTLRWALWHIGALAVLAVVLYPLFG